MRFVFSECLNDNALGTAAGVPPGRPPGFDAGGILGWGAVSRVLQSSITGGRRAFDGVIGDLVTTVFPADCRACNGPLLGAGLVPVCDVCLLGVSGQSDSLALCGCCGTALDMEGLRFVGAHVPAEGLLCSECRLVPPAFARAVAYGVYQDELRTMVHLLKYERVRAMARPLGEKLAAAMLMLEAATAKELMVVAVPLFPAKERQRGYNQAALLAESAVAVLKTSKPNWKLRIAKDCLRRVRDTESQFALTSRQRRVNLRGAFAVLEGADLIGREVMLVDDIYTTGATARECARVLRQAGAAKVWVATATRAQPQMVAMWGDG